MRKAEPNSPLPTGKVVRIPSAWYTPRKASEQVAGAFRSSTIKALGGEIRVLRKARHWSGGELASRLGVSRSLLSRIERGLVAASIDTLSRIATALDVPLQRFFVKQGDAPAGLFVPAGQGLVVDHPLSSVISREEMLGRLSNGAVGLTAHLVSMSAADQQAFVQSSALRCLYVVAGKANLRFGARRATVVQGDSLLINATLSHDIEAVLEPPFCYLAVDVELTA